MGVVFFLVALLFLTLLGLFVLAAGVLMFIIAIIKKKKRAVLIVVGCILFVAGLPMFASLPATVYGFAKMNELNYPVKGEEISELGYQEDGFTVGNTKYKGLDFNSTFKFGNAQKTPVFTYRDRVFIFWKPVSGYYYKIEDESLKYSLYISDCGDLFCKESDFEGVNEYYSSCDTQWSYYSYEFTEEEKELLYAVHSMDKMHKQIVDLSDVECDWYYFSLISADGYILYSTESIMRLNGEYYLDCGCDYIDGVYYYEFIKLPVSVSSLCNNIDEYNSRTE